MPAMNLRHAVRAIVLDDDDRILLCRLALQKKIVWAAPGGGVEPGETSLAALRRELGEEVGLAVEADPPHVWHQRVVASGHAAPRDLATPLGALLAGGPSARPVRLGL
ncbi:NUDIX domain-containing protein [Nonomuraea wenchangensis]